MRRTLNAEDEAFRQQVENFIAAHWPSGDEVVTELDHVRWSQALVTQGWSVPEWPIEAGGMGWTATQQFIWQTACASRGIELDADLGVSIIGPMLLRQAQPAQQQLFLPDIRALRKSWCIGCAETPAGLVTEHMITSADRADDGYILQGCKIWVMGAQNADWMICLARIGSDSQDFALFAIDLAANGIVVTATPTLDGLSSMAQVKLDQVWVPAAHLLCAPGSGEDFVRHLEVTALSTLGHSAVAQAQLDALDQSLVSLDEQDPLHSRRDAVAVQLLALQALELRFLDAINRDLPAPFSPTLLRLRSREILLHLGELQLECFGYYALPYPDEALLHNEGAIGPKGATSAVRSQLTAQVAALYEGSVERLKDELARQVVLGELGKELGKEDEPDKPGR